MSDKNKVERRKIDRDLLIRTFHSWCRAKKEYHKLYPKCEKVTHEMVEDIFRTMPTIHHHVLQAHYYQKCTGWAKKTKRDQRSTMLSMARIFLGEYNRNKFKIGDTFDPYQPKPRVETAAPAAIAEAALS